MNILPFVTILILVISLLISSCFQGYKETAFSKLGFIGKINAYRETRNSAEQSRFHVACPGTKKKSLNPDTSEKEKSPSHFREHITDNSKFNFAPLLKDESPFLEEVLNRLLHNFYPDLPKGFTKALLTAARNLPSEEFSFENIVLPDKKLHAVWYKMLKGSPERPPLSHHLIFKKNKPEVVIASKASIPLLKAFFGEEITAAILEKEEEPDRKTAYIKKDELSPILTAHPIPPERMPYFSCNTKGIERRTKTKTDPKTGITAELSYNVKSD